MSMKIKMIIAAVLAALFISLGSIVAIQNTKIHRLNEDLAVAVNNVKAYEAEVDSLNGNAIQFELTAAQLNHSKDSVIQKLNETRKQLKKKDKEISELQYIASENRKVDSIYVRDTIFRNPEFVLDTTISDKWSKLNLHAAYPNVIAADYSFNNETSVVMSNSRVTIDPPKKFFLCRWFQKKHTVVEVNVIQDNPYCTNRNEKFVKIIK